MDEDFPKELVAAFTDLLERAELIQEEAGELDPPPFPPAVLEKARAVLKGALDRLYDENWEAEERGHRLGQQRVNYISW